jgi:uncharacterized membrane protein
MPNLVVMTFGDEAEAGQVLEALRAARHDHGISLDDSAVVIKTEDGTVEVKNEVDRGVKIGAYWACWPVSCSAGRLAAWSSGPLGGR